MWQCDDWNQNSLHHGYGAIIKQNSDHYSVEMNCEITVGMGNWTVHKSRGKASYKLQYTAGRWDKWQIESTVHLPNKYVWWGPNILKSQKMWKLGGIDRTKYFWAFQK